MFSWYLVFKFIHILSAFIAVGANVTYGVWQIRAAKDPSHLPFALKGIKFIDDRIANPAYGVVLITGLIMMFAGNWGFALWIIIALILFAAIVVLEGAFSTPSLANQIRLADAGDTSSPEFVRLSNLGRRLGPGIGVLVVVILVMMVFKPSL